MTCSRAGKLSTKRRKDLQGLGDEQWDSLLKGLMLEYVSLVTSPQPPGITAPPLGAPDVVAKDAARAAACAAAAGGGSGGDADADAAGAGEDANAGGAGAGADDAASASQGPCNGEAASEEADETQPEPTGKKGGRKAKAAGVSRALLHESDSHCHAVTQCSSTQHLSA